MSAAFPQRKADTVLGGYWEFPGGKCEPGETPAACVIREILEETGLTIAAEQACPIIEHDYPHARVRLHPFLCHHVAGTLELRQVAAARWVPAAELAQYRFPEANAPLLQAVMAGKPPTI